MNASGETDGETTGGCAVRSMSQWSPSAPRSGGRRERVLDAAEIVLAEVGVTATMDEIAEAAGIGRRTLFRYFPSREDLIAAAIERRYQRLDREVFDDAHLAADDPDELIRRADRPTASPRRWARRTGRSLPTARS